MLADDCHRRCQHGRQHDRWAMPELAEPCQSDDGQAGKNAQKYGKKNEGGGVGLRLFRHPGPDEPHPRANRQGQAKTDARESASRGGKWFGLGESGRGFHVYMVRNRRPS